MITGRFYLELTPTGDLNGEYSNRCLSSPGIYAENATRIGNGSGWLGDYNSTWQEAPGSKSESALLEITQKNPDLFFVKWYEASSNKTKTKFEGEAMLAKGMLIGDYTD